jgi:hypothetical protein
VPTKGLALQNYREKEAYLQYEVNNKISFLRGALGWLEEKF